MGMTEAQREEWLKESYPTLDIIIGVMCARKEVRPPTEQRLVEIIENMNHCIRYVIEKKSNLEVENSNLKDLLAAIDRRA